MRASFCSIYGHYVQERLAAGGGLSVGLGIGLLISKVGAFKDDSTRIATGVAEIALPLVLALGAAALHYCCTREEDPSRTVTLLDPQRSDLQTRTAQAGEHVL